MATIVNQLLMDAGIDRRDGISASILDIIDFRFDRIRYDVQQSNENVIECPRVAHILISLELRAIGHLLHENRILIVLGARQHRQTGIVAWADDRLKTKRISIQQFSQRTNSEHSTPYHALAVR